MNTSWNEPASHKQTWTGHVAFFSQWQLSEVISSMTSKTVIKKPQEGISLALGLEQGRITSWWWFLSLAACHYSGCFHGDIFCESRSCADTRKMHLCLQPLNWRLKWAQHRNFKKWLTPCRALLVFLMSLYYNAQFIMSDWFCIKSSSSDQLISGFVVRLNSCFNKMWCQYSLPMNLSKIMWFVFILLSSCFFRLTSIPQRLLHGHIWAPPAHGALERWSRDGQ